MLIQKIIGALKGQEAMLGKLVGDLTEEQMMAQPGMMKNHPTWQIGHLTTTAYWTASMIGGTGNYEKADLYNYGTVPSSEAGKYDSKEQLLADYHQSHELVIPLLEKLTAKDLEKETPDEGFRKLVPTIGDVILFTNVSHEQMHLGELLAWRQAMGLAGVLF